MKVGKVIYMEREEFNLLEETLRMLDHMTDDLDRLEKEDETIHDLTVDCQGAWAGLSDFLDTYNRQFVKPNELA